MTDIHVEVKFVRNLGNFESVHVTHGITDTVRPDETIDQAETRIYNKVSGWIEKRIQEIDADAGR